MRTTQQPREGHTLRAGTIIARSKVVDTTQDVWIVLRQDVELFIRAGAMDAPECYRTALDAMCKLRHLTKKQARVMFQY